MTRRSKPHQVKKGSTGKIVTVALIIIGLVGAGYALFIYRTPDVSATAPSERMVVSYANYFITRTPNVNGSGIPLNIPAADLTITPTFEAQGDFGANNPIHVSVLIEFANLTLTDYYCNVYFTNGVRPDAPSETALLPIYRSGSVYRGNGTIEWEVSGPTWSWLTPCKTANIQGLISADTIEKGRENIPTFTIAPIENTRNWENNEWHTRFEIIIFAAAPALVAGGKRLLDSLE